MDNKHIIFADRDDLWTVAMTGDCKPSVFLKTTYRERQPAFSPDGRWVVYSSDSSGREEVYIRPFPPGETVHPVSRTGGWAPRWRHDGKELFFVSRDARMMAVGVDPATGTTVGVPRDLFPTDFRPENNRPYDVTRDGQRFLDPDAPAKRRCSRRPELADAVAQVSRSDRRRRLRQARPRPVCGPGLVGVS